MTPLRVAVLAPISWRVPPRHYGPWEQFASLLTEGLVAKGVDVTLFATADSATTGRLASVVARAYSEDPDVEPKVGRVPPHRARLRARRRVRPHPQQLRLPPADLQRARRDARADDDPRVLVASGSCRSTSATTRAPPTSRSATPTGTRASTTSRRSITGSTPTRSRCTRRPAATCSSSGGSIRTREPPRRSTSRCDAGLPLVIAGIVQDQQYFDERVAPRLDGERVSFIGAVSAEERSEVLGGAHALLHPIGFDEPFGYSVVEAMACGTPVIAFRRGSMARADRGGEDGLPRRRRRGRRCRGRAGGNPRPHGDPRSGGGPVRRRADGRRVPRRPTPRCSVCGLVRD